MSTDVDQIWKDEAIERMADNDRVILEQRDRIATLEFHLGKLRDLLWLGYTNTHGMLPLLPVKDAAPTKKKRKST